MNRLERLHAIAEHLRRSAPSPVSARSLADRFEVSRRTIERDLAALRNSGVPIYAEHGRSGGQVRLDAVGSAVLSLTPAEVAAIAVALAAAGPYMPFRDAGASATSRLLDALGPASQVVVEDLRSRIRVPAQPPVPKRASRTIEQALRRRLVVNIDYTDARGAETSRSVDPVGFHHGGDGWHLIAWCHLRRQGRLFRLDRVRRARLTAIPCAEHDVDEVLGWVPEAVRSP